MQSLLNSRVRTLAGVWILFAASTFAAGQGTHTIAAGGGYTYGRTNVVPGSNCFSFNGATAEMQFLVGPHLAILANVTGAHSSGITLDGYALTQTTFMGGFRYFPVVSGRILPFGDAMLGLAHASGSLSPSQTAYGSSNALGA